MTPHGSLIDEIVREGARRILAAALEAEVNTCIAELADRRDESGRRLVVRSGYHQARKVTTAAGVIEVKAPRVNDKRVDEAGFAGVVRRMSPATARTACGGPGPALGAYGCPPDSPSGPVLADGAGAGQYAVTGISCPFRP